MDLVKTEMHVHGSREFELRLYHKGGGDYVVRAFEADNPVLFREDGIEFGRSWSFTRDTANDFQSANPVGPELLKLFFHDAKEKIATQAV